MNFNEAGSVGSKARTAAAPAPGRPVEPAKKFNPKETKEVEIPENPIFLKIRKTLQQTDPGTWRRGGEDLNPLQKHPKALDSWEQAFVLEIKDGTLVIRSTQKVKSEYFGGGFTISPIATEECFVEIRGSGWNIRELIDPYYRNSSRKNARCDLLVEGPMALILFREVKQIVESFNSEKRKSFEEECFALLKELPELVKASESSVWQTVESRPEVTRYSAMFKGMCVDIARAVHGDSESFHLKFGKNEMHKTMNSSYAAEMFKNIEELGQNAKLMTLSKVLETIEF